MPQRIPAQEQLSTRNREFVLSNPLYQLFDLVCDLTENDPNLRREELDGLRLIASDKDTVLKRLNQEIMRATSRVLDSSVT